MTRVTFITGNQNKADFLTKFLDHPIGYRKIDLDEIQSLNSAKIVEHKARQAFTIINGPVLVEDITFSMESLGGRLPGPFIKWFIEEIGFEKLCRMADSDSDRKAITAVCYAYFDGDNLEIFRGEQKGTIPDHPRGDDGFGWNGIFIPEGSSKTNAEMNEEETQKFSLRTTTVYPQIKEFLIKLDKS